MSELTAAADALIDTLQEESRLCSALLAITDNEERAIIASNVSDLTALTDEKERLLELLATLETERMTALVAIGLATGRDALALTLTEVAGLVAGADRARLLAVQVTVRAASDALELATRRNSVLLRASRELVDRWVQYLKNVLSGSLTYSPEGASQGEQQSRVIDRSA